MEKRTLEQYLDADDFLIEKGFSYKLLWYHIDAFAEALKTAYVEEYGVEPKYEWRHEDGSDCFMYSYFERDIGLFDATFEEVFGGIPHLVTPEE